MLRAASAAVLFVQAARHLWVQGAGMLIPVTTMLAFCAGVLLLIGCLTRWAALVALLINLAGLLSWLPASWTSLSAGTTSLAVMIALAVLCLGPGAFSADARFFGLREVLIPDESPPSSAKRGAS